jgi:hypothetical protein
VATLTLIALTFLQVGHSRAPFSIAYEKTLWPNKSVRVCFGNASHYSMTGMPAIDFSPNQKTSLKNGDVLGEIPADIRAKIKTIIQKEYTLSRTGIHFVGWETCAPNAENADAVILMGSKDFSFEFDGYAAVGRNLDGIHNAVENLEKKAFVYMNYPGSYRGSATMPDQDFMNILAVHEFGHLAGLAHENFRISKKNQDPNCKLIMDQYDDFINNEVVADEPNANDGNPRDVVMENVIAYSKYDPNSVMSYCYWDVMSQVTGLRFKIGSTLPEENKFEPSEKGTFARGAIYLGDPTLYTKKKLSPTITEIQIRPGLSAGDVHTLRCLHGAYKPEVKAKKCTPDYAPLQDMEIVKLVNAR